MDNRPIYAYGLSKTGLADLCATLDAARYRADQVWDWLFSRPTIDWSDMSNIPERLRRDLSERLSLHPCRLMDTDGDSSATRKLLLRLYDDDCVETVVIPAAHRLTVCLSSQAGCRFNCSFCASGKSGFKRNLVAGEIVGQFMQTWHNDTRRPSHIVLMGVGEPFDNYDNVLAAVRILNDKDGLNVAARRITISTCGVIPGILRLADEDLQVELSVSLHAATDDLRTGLMPVNRKYPITDLLAACKRYSAHTNRIITFEYTLVSGLNDSKQQALALAGLLKDLQCRVNLISLSPVEEFSGGPPSRQTVDRFAAVLKAAGINTTFRASRGKNVDAACGQLRWSNVRSGGTNCR